MKFEVACEGIMFSDMVIREQGTGKLSLIGIFTHFNSQGFPFTSPPFYATIFLTNFGGKVGPFDVTLRLEEPKSGHVYNSVLGKVDIPPDAPPLEKNAAIELPMQIPPTRFPEQASYFVVVLVDGEEVKRRAIIIRSVTAK